MELCQQPRQHDGEGPETDHRTCSEDEEVDEVEVADGPQRRLVEPEHQQQERAAHARQDHGADRHHRPSEHLPQGRSIDRRRWKPGQDKGCDRRDPDEPGRGR